MITSSNNYNDSNNCDESECCKSKLIPKPISFFCTVQKSPCCSCGCCCLWAAEIDEKQAESEMERADTLKSHQNDSSIPKSLFTLHSFLPPSFSLSFSLSRYLPRCLSFRFQLIINIKLYILWRFQWKFNDQNKIPCADRNLKTQIHMSVHVSMLLNSSSSSNGKNNNNNILRRLWGVGDSNSDAVATFHGKWRPLISQWKFSLKMLKHEIY